MLTDFEQVKQSSIFDSDYLQDTPSEMSKLKLKLFTTGLKTVSFPENPQGCGTKLPRTLIGSFAFI
jgi:hypothetical protein